MKLNNIVFLLMLSCGWLYAVPDISVDVARLRNGKDTYVEMSLYVVGGSLLCDSIQQRFGLGYVVMVKDSLDQVHYAAKYQLTRTGCPAQDIFDVRRLPLNHGQYIIEVVGYDLADTMLQTSVLIPIHNPEDPAQAWLSDIQLLSMMKGEPEGTTPMHKQGIYMEPLPFHFYYPALKAINIYLEAYDADQLAGQPYMRYTIKPVEGDVPSPLVSYKKLTKTVVNPCVYQLDISTLITGYYVIEAALFDGDKNLIQTQKQIFSRLNPEGDSLFLASGGMTADYGFAGRIPEDSLEYALKAIAPIATSLDVEVINTLVKKKNPAASRYFIHKFWTQQSGKYAGPAFVKYMEVARIVDETYRSGFGYGFETDRGYIFLKYGQPNDIISVEDEPSAPPYEIWFYNNFPATHQTNVKFLFYNPSLVRNGHELLHSNANGETKNPRWEIELYRDATLETPGVNETKMGDNVHRNARTYFEN